MQNFLKHFTFVFKKPELAFVLLALIFGLIYIFKLAPLRGTDEFTHFARVYQVSDGTLWEQKIPGNKYGGELPVNVNSMINDFRVLTYSNFTGNYTAKKQHLISKYSHISNPGSYSQQADFTSSYLYPPWAYLEDLVGIFIAKVAHLPLVWYVYLARISSLLFWILAVWLAIRLIPAGKWFLVALALVPTSLTQAATVSGDGLLISLSWLTFALTIAVLAKKVKLDFKTQIFLVVLAVSMCILKNGYYLIGLFPLVIPASYFKDKKSAYRWRTVTLVLTVSASLIFIWLGLKNVGNAPTIIYPNLNVNAHAQLSYIAHHLLVYIYRMFAWLGTRGYDIIYLGIVGVITNRVIVLPIAIILLIYFGLIMSYLRIEPQSELQKQATKLRLAAAIVVLGTYCLIITAFYLNASGVGAHSVNGVWGRYFLPVIPFLTIFAYTSKKRFSYKATNSFKIFLYSVLIIALTSTMFYIN